MIEKTVWRKVTILGSTGHVVKVHEIHSERKCERVEVIAISPDKQDEILMVVESNYIEALRYALEISRDMSESGFFEIVRRELGSYWREFKL